MGLLDTLFGRHGGAIRRELERFRPDVIHITGPSELGMFGAYFAWEMGVPLAASWHTNLHEYAARRMAWLTGRMAESRGAAIEGGVEAGALWEIAEAVPPEWYGGDTAVIERLMEQMLRRRSKVRELIGEFRNSDREPFPMWASGKTIVVPRQFAEVSGVGKFVM